MSALFSLRLLLPKRGVFSLPMRCARPWQGAAVCFFLSAAAAAGQPDP